MKVSSGYDIDAQTTSDSGAARCCLKKHLTWKNGQPKYSVLESDSVGPLVVQSIDSMAGQRLIWARVGVESDKRGKVKDLVFELRMRADGI